MMPVRECTPAKPTRFMLVGILCAGLHNTIMLGGDWAGLHYIFSTLLSLGVVGLVGYLAHSRWTFQGICGNDRSLAAYYLMVSANLPMSLTGMFLMVDVIGTSVAIAAPAVTVVLFAWNYLATHWAMGIRKRRPRHDVHSSPKWRDIAPFKCPEWLPAEGVIHRYLASRQLVYRFHRPHYQTQVLTDLAQLLPDSAQNILDIGAGNGLMGQAIASLFPHKAVVGIDVHDRFLPTLTIPHAIFDGIHLPFGNSTFDGVLLCNVLHHVSEQRRAPLLKEAVRVAGGGPLLIKDHLAEGWLAHMRLATLDWIGNVPFGGMVKAKYLDASQRMALFRELDCEVEAICGSPYRNGLWKTLFPNRLEILFRATPRKKPKS